MSIDNMFNQFLGSAPASPQGGNGRETGGLAGLTSGIPGGLAGGLAAGALMGVLMGNKKLRKTAGKFAGGAAAIGGTAALGALAYNAYQSWQTGFGQNGRPAPQTHSQSAATPSAFNPSEIHTEDGQDFQIVLVKAMIAAANADGHIDSDEQSAVFEAVNKLQLDNEAKALVFDTLKNPPTVEALAGQANGIEQASEIYLASRLAIDPDHPAEQAYLRQLAESLKLPADLVTQLELQIGEAPVRAA